MQNIAPNSPFVSRQSCLISYSRFSYHNTSVTKKRHIPFVSAVYADCLRFWTARKSTDLGCMSIDVLLSSACLFSRIHRAIIAIAISSIQTSISIFKDLEMFAERFCADNSKSCSIVADTSNRNSTGGIAIDAPRGDEVNRNIQAMSECYTVLQLSTSIGLCTYFYGRA